MAVAFNFEIHLRIGTVDVRGCPLKGAVQFLPSFFFGPRNQNEKWLHRQRDDQEA